MFFRAKSVGSYQYLQIVHSVRQGEKVRQQVFGTLGRLDELKARGRLEVLARALRVEFSRPACSSVRRWGRAAAARPATRDVRVLPEWIENRIQAGLTRRISGKRFKWIF